MSLSFEIFIICIYAKTSNFLCDRLACFKKMTYVLHQELGVINFQLGNPILFAPILLKTLYQFTVLQNYRIKRPLLNQE